MKTKLKLAPHAAAYAVHYEAPRSVSLVSYATRVLDLLLDTDTPEPVLKVRGIWSRATGKHMWAFVAEYVDADPDLIMRCIKTVTRTACHAVQLSTVRIEYDPTMPVRY